MKIKKVSMKLLSLLIVAVMMLGVMSPVVSATNVLDHLHSDKAGNETLHYVSLGASNTNGYGHHGYLDAEIYEDPLAAPKANMNDYGYDKAPANAYPALIRDALAAKTGREVELHQLAISSMRVEEVLWLLDDNYVPDEYMDWRFTGGKSWFDMAHKEGGREALRVEYREYIANADVITVDLGWNNFGVYAFNNIMTILKEGGSRYWKAPAFDRVIDAGMEEEYYAIRDKVIERLNEMVDLSDTALSNDVIQMLADVLAYAAFGACYNFDKVVEKIYELNPDADVVVINIQNLADELVVNLDGTELPLGDLYGELIEFVDLYRATMSPYADRYGFAYAGEDGDVDTFLDEFRLWDGDPTTLSQDMKDLFDMYDDNLYVRSKIEYIMVGQVFAQIFAELRETAKGYGLSAFVNDSKYTYEIPAFDMSWLNNIDLATLDFKNPDTGIEIYGAALAPHLVNLRDYNGEGKDAYNYVFDDLIRNLTGIDSLDAAIEKKNEILNALDPALQESYAQLIQFVTILEGARNEFNNAFFALNMVYNNTLNYAYDTVGTIIQYSLQFNTFHMTPDSMANHNDKTEELLGYVVNTFTNNTMLKFYEELGKIGLDNSGAVAPEITVNEELFSDPLIQAVAALEVRYDFGNSFFAHPSVKGNQQIKDAVMDVLENGSHADQFTDKKLNQYIDIIEDYLNPYYQEKYAELKANGTIDAMLSGLDAFEGALDVLEREAVALELPEGIDLERAENIRALLLEEIDLTRVSVAELRKLLNTEALEFGTEDFAKLRAIERHLVDHANTIGALATEIGLFAEPYVEEIASYVELYANVVADIAKDSYDYLANGVEEFNEEYLAFVELVGSYVDKVDTELGAAVRAYLIDTPNDALNIICEYGKDAVLKLVVDAVATRDDIYSSVSAIALILAEHGEGIYNEISSDEEYKALLSAIEAKALELVDLYKEANESPALVALDIDKIVAKQRAELEALYSQLVEVVIKNANEYDEEVASLLWAALMDTADALGVIGENGENYLVWLDGRTDAMLGALLHSFLQNTDELIGATKMVVWKHLNHLNAFLVNVTNDITAQISLQLALIEAELERIADCVSAEVAAKIADIKAKIAAIRLAIDKGIADIKEIITSIETLINEIITLVEQVAEDVRGEIIALIDTLNTMIADVKEVVRAVWSVLDDLVEFLESLDNLTLKDMLGVMELIKEFDITLGDYFGEEYNEIKSQFIDKLYKAFNGEYVVGEDDFYIAIADNNSAYADLLAAALGLGDMYAVMGWDNIDMDVLSNADFVTMSYDQSRIEGFAVQQFLAAVASYGNDSLRAQVAEYLAKALGDDLSDDKVDEYTQLVDGYIVATLERPEFAGKTVEDMDWSKLVGEENVAAIEESLAYVREYLAEQGITGDYVASVNVVDLINEYVPSEGVDIAGLFENHPVFEVSIPVADIVMLTVESYLYANIMFHMTYAETIKELVAINPEVQIAVLGQYNPFKDITVMGVEIPMGQIYGNIVTLNSVNSLIYAFALPNVTYVDISDVETTWDALDFEEFLESYLENPYGVEFTNSSNLYVMHQILNAYGLACKHVYDDCEDAECNICGEVRDDAGHRYEASVTEPDCTNGGYITYLCVVCGHTYVADEVDALGHKFGEWTAVSETKEERKCSVCGYTESRDVDPVIPNNPQPTPPPIVDTPEPEEKLSPAAIAGIVVGAMVIVGGVVAAVITLLPKKKKTK